MSVPTLDVQRAARRSRRSARSRAWREDAWRAARDRARRDEVALVVTSYWGEAGEVTTTPVPEPPKPHHELYERCLSGREVAEALPTKLRELLVAELCTARWTDQQIAEHTRMTLYTTARIRAGLGLSKN